MSRRKSAIVNFQTRNLACRAATPQRKMGNHNQDLSNKKKKKRKSRKEESSDEDVSASLSDEEKQRRNKKKHKHSRRSKKKHKKKTTSSSSEEEGLQLNDRLQQKLAARGETLEERQERRAKKRAAQISATFGYTAEDNPFNDPNLHEKFTWKKAAVKKDKEEPSGKGLNSFAEIEKVRKRRTDREKEMEERERSRAEENRRKELENYDEWASKEEAFHLQQQRQRSAIRLVEGRETPIDVLAKNVLMFGLTEQEQTNRARVKYQEKYDAMDALEYLEAELEDPASLLKKLKLEELEGLKVDIKAFSRLEREAVAFGETDHVTNTVVRYWDNLMVIVNNEIKSLRNETGVGSNTSTKDVSAIFFGRSHQELEEMKLDIENKMRNPDPNFDRDYWSFVREQLLVHIARLELAEQHSHMLVRQLERLETKRSELASQKSHIDRMEAPSSKSQEQTSIPQNVDENFGNVEEEMTEEVDLKAKTSERQGKQMTRKPRYFNRVKTGYDWNKYNQTHYDVDNPPPKTVQGYKFNIFYPELLDPTTTPQFRLEPADSDEFCIIRFTAGPPYEDIAFKIVNRRTSRVFNFFHLV